MEALKCSQSLRPGIRKQLPLAGGKTTKVNSLDGVEICILS